MKLFLLIASIATAQDYVRDMKRLFAQPDGQVLILTVAPDACGAIESKQACFRRIATKDCPKDANGRCYPHADIPKTSLPDRSKRNKWRAIDPRDPSRGLRIDETIVTRTDQIAVLEAQIDAELAKPSPDSIAVLKAQRQLDKIKATREEPVKP